MKTTLIPLVIVSLLFCVACGSTEKVITDQGKVYEVKGDKFYNNGKEVTQTLSNSEKDEILETLNQRLKVEAQAEQQQKALEKAQKEAEKAMRKAEKAQEKLADKMQEKEEARKDFFKLKDKLKSKKEKYQRLLDKGKLSPNDKEKWEHKIKNLEKEVEDAEKNLKRI